MRQQTTFLANIAWGGYSAFLPLAFYLMFGFIALHANPAEAKLLESMVEFFSLKETVAKSLPEAKQLSRRDIVLEKRHLDQLAKHKNWDSKETEFVIYHSKTAEKNITGTLILFPEQTRQGTIVVAVSLDNKGRVTQALVMEAQQPTVQWLLPLLRTDYMKTFIGKNKSLKLKLAEPFKSDDFSAISRTYALRLANAVKKSSQLFHVYFNRSNK
jgi:hypothetical protein